MKFSTSLLVLACVCAVVSANAHGNAKHQSRKLVEAHHKASRSAKLGDNTFSAASMKSAINAGADGLSRAFDVVTPLAREAVSLTSDIASRVMKGGSESKESRAADANLLARVDSLISRASRAYNELGVSRIAEGLAEKAAAASSALAKAKAVAANAKAAVSAALAGYAA